MTEITVAFAGGTYRVDVSAGHDLSIALDFRGPQPNHFGGALASAAPMGSGEFVGDTRQGGSCNADVLTLTPHCNGTHTECVGHLTDERISIADIAIESFLPAALLSIAPVPAKHCEDTADPASEPADRLISRESLSKAWLPLPPAEYPALVVRTLPNPIAKKHRVYTPVEDHPYFSLEAMEMLVARGVRHLLVDTPSVDRYEDRGRLSGHRLFWGMERGSRKAPESGRRNATITEMVYAEAALEDGLYLLNLQVPGFRSDAAPSRPILYPMVLL